MNAQRTTSSDIAPGISVAPGGLRMQFARGSGPGGQNVNKVNTQAELWLELSSLRGLNDGAMRRLTELAAPHITLAGEIHLWSSTHRTQERNRAEVMDKLRELIVRAMVVPKKRRRTKPTAGSRRRRLEGKRHRGEIKAGRRGAEDGQ
jgi:ribosome-associated protein